MKKLIIITAPSGSGKTTIVRHLLKRFSSLAFSVSATTRPPRTGEKEGEDYYFLSREEFQSRIREKAFVEWEEVYSGRFYGTLRTEIERLWQEGKDVIFDIDTQGALNLKKQFPERSLAIFIKAPSLDVLGERLRERSTESEGELEARLSKAARELGYENHFDRVLVNDELGQALKEAEELVAPFLEGGERVDPKGRIP